MTIQYKRQDSKPRPLEHKSPPITTRPGLPSYKRRFMFLSAKLCLWTKTFCRKERYRNPLQRNRNCYVTTQCLCEASIVD